MKERIKKRKGCQRSKEKGKKGRKAMKGKLC